MAQSLSQSQLERGSNIETVQQSLSLPFLSSSPSFSPSPLTHSFIFSLPFFFCVSPFPFPQLCFPSWAADPCRWNLMGGLGIFLRVGAQSVTGEWEVWAQQLN